jgi:hypothetical protein
MEINEVVGPHSMAKGRFPLGDDKRRVSARKSPFTQGVVEGVSHWRGNDISTNMVRQVLRSKLNLKDRVHLDVRGVNHAEARDDGLGKRINNDIVPTRRGIGVGS